ncbi:isochorismate synthase [Candidatus Neptunichlamydia sp. REUL1]|uniref:isochorismate synthase n=1 Tax=Candidatus Neptunichlamydia sp. REUL1 TaxID=3064277 RepID=UPI00293016E6|nr:isochorismate synthase [Candidatus Neptunochlamydia sp. REUL1]
MRQRLVTSSSEILKSLLNTPFRPEPFTLNGKTIPHMRLEIPFPVNDLFAWLEAQTLYPKVYFETPHDGIVAGVGSAMKISHIHHFNGESAPQFFGGRDFMKRKRKTWKEFPECAYFLPLIQIEKRDTGTYLCINRLAETLNFSIEPEASLLNSLKLGSRFDSPSYSVWEREVSEILKGIRQGDSLKVVLARCTKIETAEKPSAYSILKMLQGKNRFAFQFSKDQTFIGNSPETLYRRMDNRIESAAIAGTRARGKSPEENAKLEDALLNCPKERHELQVVRDTIVSTLSPLCQSLQIDSCKVLQTPNVQHLHHHIEGALKEGFSDESLINALHPTPAVGGFPKEIAFTEIGKREAFDRGWYAAPIGYISPNQSHHLVAIRSALVEEDAIRLFAGTGLVNGSNPSREWDELEHKISQYMGIL